jgi:hypothetical protein
MQRLEVSCAVRPKYGSLGAKGLIPQKCYLLFSMVLQPSASYGLLVHEVS